MRGAGAHQFSDLPEMLQENPGRARGLRQEEQRRYRRQYRRRQRRQEEPGWDVGGNTRNHPGSVRIAWTGADLQGPYVAQRLFPAHSRVADLRAVRPDNNVEIADSQHHFGDTGSHNLRSDVYREHFRHHNLNLSDQDIPIGTSQLPKGRKVSTQSFGPFPPRLFSLRFRPDHPGIFSCMRSPKDPPSHREGA